MNVSALTTFAAEEAEGIAALGLDPIKILLQAGTFLLLFFIIRKFALEKIVQGLNDRHVRIEESLKMAEVIDQRDKASEEEREALLKKAHGEADSVIAKAHEAAGAMIKEAEDTANKKADKIIADANNKIDGDIKKARESLKGELLNMVAQATETVLEEKLDAAKDKKLMEKALTGVQQ